MPDNKYSYKIGGSDWQQRPLVLGQWQQMMETLRGFSIDLGSGIPHIIETLGSRLPLVLAVVLIKADGDLKHRFGLRYITTTEGVQIPEWYQDPDVMLDIANEIHSGIDAETTLRVIDDFLACNPVSLILDRLSGVMATAMPLMKAMSMASIQSPPFSPEEISPDATASSGATPLETVSPSLNSVSERSPTENQ